MANIVRRDPFDELMRWPARWFDSDGIRSLWPRTTAWSPRCDVTEKDDEMLIRAELPGVAADDIDITVDDGVITLRGEKREEQKEEKDGRTYSERFFGSFSRSVALPAGADEAKVSANLKDGVLEVHVPHAPQPEPKQAKKIQVKAS